MGGRVGFGGLLLSTFSLFPFCFLACANESIYSLAGIDREEIKQRWEDVRGDLTRQFKKRHREAVKKRRRGHGTTMAEREAE